MEKHAYRFDTGKGMIVEFESLDSMASKSVIPGLWVAGDANNGFSVHLDMGTLAIENIKSGNVTLWGAGAVGNSGRFGFTSSIFKDGSTLYVVINEMTSMIVGPGMATVGVYTYNAKSDHIDASRITTEEFRSPEQSVRDLYLTSEYAENVANNTRALLDNLTEAFGTVVPLAKLMKDNANTVEVAVPTNADLQKLYDLN